ncbi:MAG: hypothetical protein K0R51_1555 [Cytophagaceae bacterium]|nr:hypothetical protein [Cytophagaceae bacterium]
MVKKCVETERRAKMKKKKISKKAIEIEEQNPNSSPVCYAENKDLRPEYKDDSEKPSKKQHKA